MKYDLTKREKKMCFAVHSVAFARDYMSGVCVCILDWSYTHM